MLKHAREQVSDESRPMVPVMSPRLPSAERLLPYLRRIDAARTYTNFGPLVLELEERLSAQLCLPAGGLVTASSGTAALVGAMLATAGRATAERPFALMPAYTFVATAVAAEQCGYKPYLADIDPETWMLDPERLLEHPELHRIGVVIPVAAYGKGVPQAKWLEFRERTGIPVVIDGAASFEAACAAPEISLGDIPVAMSFHATKGFACGEGGAVVCTDETVNYRTVKALNFGFHSSRNSRCASTNGKMSEYHAAVGLAELDDWGGKVRAFRMVADQYRRLLKATGQDQQLIAAPSICSSYVLFECDDQVQSDLLQSRLGRDRVEFRLWYGHGIRSHEYFRNSEGMSLPVTQRLAHHLLGLPMAPDLSAASVARVVSAIQTVVSSAPGRAAKLQRPRLLGCRIDATG